MPNSLVRFQEHNILFKFKLPPDNYKKINPFFHFHQEKYSLIKKLIPLLSLSLFLCGGLLNAQWIQVGSDIDGEAAGDEPGISVSLSAAGTRVAIGARGNDGNGLSSGHVRVYEESGGVWSQAGSDIDSEAAGDRSGRSVSLSSDGTRVAIGAATNDGNGTYAGQVRVYRESGGVWSQVGSDIDGEAADDRSGWSVSLSSAGTPVAIEAPLNAGNGTGAGYVRVYKDATLTDIIPIGHEVENGFYIKSVFAGQKQLSVTFNLPFYNNITATLYDLDGRLIASDKRFSGEGLNTLILDIGSLPAGVYVVHLWNGQTRVSEKFVKP